MARPFINLLKRVLGVLNLLFDGHSTKSSHGYNLQYCHPLLPFQATKKLCQSRKVDHC